MGLKALAIAVRNMDARRRVTLLRQRLQALGGGTALPGQDARSEAGRTT
jgi:hypothetical protein